MRVSPLWKGSLAALAGDMSLAFVMISLPSSARHTSFVNTKGLRGLGVKKFTF